MSFCRRVVRHCRHRSTNFLHKPVAIQAMEAGSHVLAKTVAMNTAEAEEMVAVSKRLNKRLAVNFRSASGVVYPCGNSQPPENSATFTMGRPGGYAAGIPKLGGWFTTKSHLAAAH